MGEQCHIALYSANLGNYTVNTDRNLVRTFPTGAAVGENQPPVPYFLDLFGSQSLIFAVVPFHEIAI